MAVDPSTYQINVSGIVAIEDDPPRPAFEVYGAADEVEALGSDDQDTSYIRQTFDPDDTASGLYNPTFLLEHPDGFMPEADSDDYRTIRIELSHGGGLSGLENAFFRDLTGGGLDTVGDMGFGADDTHALNPPVQWDLVHGYYLGAENGIDPAQYNYIVGILNDNRLTWQMRRPQTFDDAPFDISYIRFYSSPTNTVIPTAPVVTDVEASSGDAYEIPDIPGVRYSVYDALGTVSLADQPPGVYPAAGHFYWTAHARPGYRFPTGIPTSWDYEWVADAIPTVIIGQLGDSRRTFYGGPST